MRCFNELQIVIGDFFNVTPEAITSETTANEIEDWDSFSHMELMSKIETHFNIKIPFTDIMEFNRIGDIVTYLDTKAP
jgi:acyl carrier protein